MMLEFIHGRFGVVTMITLLVPSYVTATDPECDDSCQNDTPPCEYDCDDAIYVNCDATGANDGTSWEDAFVSIQDAADAATNGKFLMVHGGCTFTPPVDGEPVLEMKDGVEYHGGCSDFDYIPPDIMVPNINHTILSGESGTAGCAGNSAHVVMGASDVRFQQFVITDGCETSGSPTAMGAGMFVEVTGELLIEWVRFTNNYVDVSGWNASVIGGGGLAVELDGGTIEVNNCIFDANEVTAFDRESGGAGLLVHQLSGGSVTIRNSSFIDNIGDGIHIDATESILIQECTVSGNDVGIYLVATYSEARVENNKIEDNGQGILIQWDQGPVRCANSSFVANGGTELGAGGASAIHYFDPFGLSGSLLVAHNSFDANESSETLGFTVFGQLGTTHYLDVLNCAFYDNGSCNFSYTGTSNHFHEDGNCEASSDPFVYGWSFPYLVHDDQDTCDLGDSSVCIDAAEEEYADDLYGDDAWEGLNTCPYIPSICEIQDGDAPDAGIHFNWSSGFYPSLSAFP